MTCGRPVSWGDLQENFRPRQDGLGRRRVAVEVRRVSGKQVTAFPPGRSALKGRIHQGSIKDVVQRKESMAKNKICKAPVWPMLPHGRRLTEIQRKEQPFLSWCYIESNRTKEQTSKLESSPGLRPEKGLGGMWSPRRPPGSQRWLGPGELSPEDPQWSRWRQEEQGSFPWVLASASPSKSLPLAEPHIPGVAGSG